MIGERRLPTGIPGLDHMLGGGLISGRPYVVTGVPGSGKTTFGIQFLQEGVRQGTNALFVTIDEPPTEVMDNVGSFGWDVGKVRILDAHPGARGYRSKAPLVEVAAQRSVSVLREAREPHRTDGRLPPEINIASLQLMLRQEFVERYYARVVIDSMTTLKLFCSTQDEMNVGIQSLLRFLTESEVTALLVTDLPDPTSLEPEIFLARGELRLHKTMFHSRMERSITIERFRGSSHDTVRRPFTITDHGIIVESNRRVRRSARLTRPPVDSASPVMGYS